MGAPFRRSPGPRRRPSPRRLLVRRLVGGALICGLLGLVGAVVSLNEISLFPPKLQPRELTVAAASTRVMIDLDVSRATDRRAVEGDFDSLARRAVMLANLLTSDAVVPDIARHAGLPADQIAAVTKVTASAPLALTEPDSERRAADIAQIHAPYRLNVQPDRVLPAFTIYTQAPTPAGAAALANAAVPGLRDYLRQLAETRGVDPSVQVNLEQLGTAQGVVVNGGAKLMIGGLTFLVVFWLSAVMLLLLGRARRGWNVAVMRWQGLEPERAVPVALPDMPDTGGSPPRLRPDWGPPRVAGAGVLALAPGAVALPQPQAWTTSPAALRARYLAARAGDWPRTTRVVPWLIAVFLAVVWLVPFNLIQLSISLPIDLKFDRLFLPFVVLAWALCMAAGGTDAPRFRVTPIHVTIAGFITAACVSLALNAPQLNHLLELDTGVKKLVLIVSYAMLFVVIASSVRRTEVHAFLTYTVALATLCALGTVVEYRFEFNVFYEGADALLPGIFQVGTAEAAAIDGIGRRLVRGPGEVPLEVVAMLSMALPIALSRLLTDHRWRDRIVYGFAAAMIMAAAVATNRKSAFVVPISVCLTLAYFRRRELLKLAPLGIVAIIAIHVMSPGAFGSILGQLGGDRLQVATVSDRASDYDAVRPDLWTHFATGRGYGTYEHTSYRIIDMQLLLNLVEIGVFGLIAYVLISVSIVGLARAPIHARDPIEAPVALAAAAAAVGFLTASTLFDIMSFPHCPYIVLSLAGFLVAVLRPQRSP